MAEPGAPSFNAIYRWLRTRPDFQARFIDACRNRDASLMVQAHLTIDTAGAPGLRESSALIRTLEGRRGRLTPRLYRWG